MKRFLAPVFAASFLLTLSVLSANACWCRGKDPETLTEQAFPATIRLEVQRSDFVFSGSIAREDRQHITFKIEKIWKGTSGEELTFPYKHNIFGREKDIFMSDCEFLFRPDRRYLVYANMDMFGLTVSLCGRTSEMDEAERDITELNRGHRNSVE